MLNLEERAALEGTEVCKLQTTVARVEQEYQDKLI